MIGRVLLGLLLVTSLVGCTTDDPPEPAPPLPKVEHPAAAVPKDRSSAAVVAALTRLDACALLDPAAAKAPGYPAGLVPVPRSPHRCELENGDGDSVEVTLGVAMNRDERYGARLVTIGGTKVYLRGRSGGLCRAAIPVSFTWTIEFTTNALGVKAPAKCDALQTFVGAAVAKLAKPDAVAARLPLARWDACTALAGVLGVPPTDDTLILGTNFLKGIDRCEGPEVRLEFLFAGRQVPSDGGKFRSLGGRQVREYRLPQCQLTWSQGPSGLRADNRNALEVTVQAGDCARADKVAVAAMRLLSGGPPAGAVPQRPLLYAAAEPDVAAAGACIDAFALDPCEPYHRVDAPKGTTEVWRRGQADPNVACAISIDAVGKHLGKAPQPVTTRAPDSAAGVDRELTCAFVEPSHELQIWVSLADRPLSGINRRPAGTKDLQIAGKPAILSSYLNKPVREDDLYVEVGDGLCLHVRLLLKPGRGGDSTTVVDTERASLLEPLAADIVAGYL